jgi:glycine cleavage system regulatory protein
MSTYSEEYSKAVARTVFKKRGNHAEAHLAEEELAAIVRAALLADPIRSRLKDTLHDLTTLYATSPGADPNFVSKGQDVLNLVAWEQ